VTDPSEEVETTILVSTSEEDWVTPFGTFKLVIRAEGRKVSKDNG